MVAAVVIAIAGALACRALHSPLPWLIGPLTAVALASMLRAPLEAPPAARQLGQWAIGVALGLYFTPDVVRKIGTLAPALALYVAFALLLNWLGAALLRRYSDSDAPTAWFATAIGSASEMTLQALRHDGRADRVAAAHSLRLVLVALIVPLAFAALDVHGLDPFAPLARRFDALGFVVLVAVTAGAAAVLQRLGSLNSWMLGPLFAAALITATGHSFSALPVGVVNAGQLLIGITLGVHFTPGFFRAAPRFLALVVLLTLIYLACSAAFGFALAPLAGLPWPTAVIATTPGGIGEMALTAQALALGVPVVTAFHVIRMAAVVLLTAPSYRLWHRRQGEAKSNP